jgi:16S rRNA G966 N2-methylase RsmD
MKYMGSKRAMLTNGLGKALDSEIGGAKRFIDLFLGTGEVAAFVARRHPVPVYGVDLQAYSVFLAEAVIARRAPIPWVQLWDYWINRARLYALRFRPPHVSGRERLTKRSVIDMRAWCAAQADLPLTRAYGGHYFSPVQSLWIDALRAALPESEPGRTVALAALIRASSQCIAAPGHTAQPFQPTRTAVHFLQDAWLRDPILRVCSWLKIIAEQHARKLGAARVADAIEIANDVGPGDLVFLDPPYSGVQYSRFYHVLESISRGESGEVSGVGRYPQACRRPRSAFSLVTKSEEALNQLLFLVATNGATAVLTFPDHECSNGLSGTSVRAIARAYFRVRENSIRSRFSTLGGRGAGDDRVARRKARREASELMLLLTPR